MLFDSTNLFSDAQALTTTDGNVVASTNVIDLGAADTPKHAANAITKDLAFGTPVEFLAQVVETFAMDSYSDETVTLDLITSAAENMSNPVTLWSSGAVAANLLVQGYRFNLQYVPKGVLRYLRVNYTPDGTDDFTAGKITAGLVFAADARHV